MITAAIARDSKGKVLSGMTRRIYENFEEGDGTAACLALHLNTEGSYGQYLELIVRT